MVALSFSGNEIITTAKLSKSLIAIEATIVSAIDLLCKISFDNSLESSNFALRSSLVTLKYSWYTVN